MIYAVAIPVWIFVWAALARLMLKFLFDRHEGAWWAFPLYMALAVPSVFIVIGGILWLGSHLM